MSTKVESVEARLASRLRREREGRGWSLAELGARSKVSRAMIHKVERGEASPTAALLGRLSGALGLTLSQLLAMAEAQGPRLARSAAQRTWVDPETRFRRRHLSPPVGCSLELIEAQLAAGARIAYPAAAYSFIEQQQVWVLEGELTLREGGETHTLGPGDCIAFGPPSACEFRNRSRRGCRYLVALVRRRA